MPSGKEMKIDVTKMKRIAVGFKLLHTVDIIGFVPFKDYAGGWLIMRSKETGTLYKDYISRKKAIEGMDEPVKSNIVEVPADSLISSLTA